MVVKRERDSVTAMAKERVASLTAECAITRATLQEQEDRLRAKEMKCEVLRLNLIKEFELRATLEQDCSSLRTANENVQKMKLVTMQLEETQARVEKEETAHQQLRDETTDELRLRVERCLCGFAMWELQTAKWLKLDLLERCLTTAKASGSAVHKQLVELVNSFSSGLEEARENIDIKIVNILRRLGANGSSEDAVTAASDGTAPESSSPYAVEMSRLFCQLACLGCQSVSTVRACVFVCDLVQF
ncbi:hypothetical protein AXG93_2145s1350 [Marchantia polymorpha subsp. ruderalis]|uniref:Uncharacterized protein n=1 Tax=Marchantia polymorpha subsp. ruderalis TaxID=1480154 RepID=A0A176W0W0_MARPO|nr:hypothetical protein AXG93_2145s1350 [Marchantia polymorpha subsp. ruderalis]